MKRTVYRTALLSVLLTALASCEECDCLPGCICGCDHVGTAPPLYRLTVEACWPEGLEPEGMTLMLYPEDGTGREYLSKDVHSRTVSLHPGRYSLLLFSLSDGEYGAYAFHGMKQLDAASVELTAAASGTRRTPQDLCEASLTDLEISSDTLIHLYPQDIVRTLHVSVPFLSFSRYLPLRGNVSGCSSSYGFAGHSPKGEGISHQMEGWNAVWDSDSTGCLHSEIPVLGIRDPLTLDLSLRFSADSVLGMLRDVTYLVTYDTLARRYSVDLTETLSVPREPMPSSGGASVDIDGWPEEENIEIVF